MISNVKLSAHSFYHPDPSTRAITHDPDWISNFHWQIQRDNVTNQIYVTPDDYGDNFRKPYTPPLDLNADIPDLWETIAFEHDREFVVTNWLYQVDSGAELRLMRGDDDGIDGIGTYCFVENAYISSLGFEVGDNLEAVAIIGEDDNTGNRLFYRLRASDLSRCVSSCTWQAVKLDDAGMEIAIAANVDSLVYNPYAKYDKRTSNHRAAKSASASRGSRKWMPTATTIMEVLSNPPKRR